MAGRILNLPTTGKVTKKHIFIFWVIFAENKNGRNWLEKKDLEILSTDLCREFSGGSF